MRLRMYRKARLFVIAFVELDILQKGVFPPITRISKTEFSNCPDDFAVCMI